MGRKEEEEDGWRSLMLVLLLWWWHPQPEAEEAEEEEAAREEEEGGREGFCTKMPASPRLLPPFAHLVGLTSKKERGGKEGKGKLSLRSVLHSFKRRGNTERTYPTKYTFHYISKGK